MNGNDTEESTMDMRFDHVYKSIFLIYYLVILVGDMGVGKTSILSKYVRGIFPTSPLPTIAIEFATKIIQLKEGGYVKAQIWDTAGQEKYKSITS
jgi:Rab family protein